MNWHITLIARLMGANKRQELRAWKINAGRTAAGVISLSANRIELLAVRASIFLFLTTALIPFLTWRRHGTLGNLSWLFPHAWCLLPRLFSGDLSAGGRQNSLRWDLRRRAFGPGLFGPLGNFTRLLLARVNAWLVPASRRDRPFRRRLGWTLWPDLFRPVRNGWCWALFQLRLVGPLLRPLFPFALLLLLTLLYVALLLLPLLLLALLHIALLLLALL